MISTEAGKIYIEIDGIKEELFSVYLRDPFMATVYAATPQGNRTLNIPITVSHEEVIINTIQTNVINSTSDNCSTSISYLPEYAEVLINHVGIDVRFAPIHVLVKSLEGKTLCDMFLLISHDTLLPHATYDLMDTAHGIEPSTQEIFKYNDIYISGMYFTEGYELVFELLKTMTDLMYNYEEEVK